MNDHANAFPSSTAVKIAWREVRASAARFAFVVIAVALGVGSLTAVRGFSAAFRDMLLKEARTLMAADLSLRIFGEPSPEQVRTVQGLEGRGVDATRITETFSMVGSTRTPVPVFVSVKAVNPRKYPFYGEFALNPPGSLRERLNASSVVVSSDLLARLGAQVGESVRIGGQEFRIAGTIVSEPDRISGGMNLGARAIISREGLDRAGLIEPGSRSANRFLFRLGAQAPPVAEVRKELERAFPEGHVTDYRQTNPNITEGLNRATSFLSLVTLIALIIGALGVGTAMHAHLRQQLDSIAIMKSLGARSGQIIKIYLLQTLLLGAFGALLGVMAGLLVQPVIPVLVVRFLDVRPALGLHLMTAAQGMAVGVLTTLLFTLPPLMSIRSIKPNALFRRDMPEVRRAWRSRVIDSRATALSGVFIVLGVFGLALWLVEGHWHDAARAALYFIGGLLASLVALALVAAGLVRLLRLVVQRSPWHLSATVRHGLANVYRPGSQAPAVLTALGIGVMFTLTIYLMEHSVLAQMQRDTPPDMPNVFLLSIRPQQRDGVLPVVREYSDRHQAPDLLPVVSVRLLSVNGKAVEPRFQRTRAVSSSPDVPGASGPAVVVSPHTAEMFDLKQGDTLEWDVYGRRVKTRLAKVQQPPRRRLIAMVQFVFSPGVLEGQPTVWYAAARVPSANIAPLQRDLYEKYPTVTVVNMADIIARVEQVVGQIAFVIRFLSLFAIAAGAMILASSVAGTRFRRLREVVILKTLGATRARIVRVFSTEFLVVGIVAGLIGSALASGFSAVIMTRLLHAPFRFDPIANVVSVALTALIATATGWLASYRILGEKPLEVLRNE